MEAFTIYREARYVFESVEQYFYYLEFPPQTVFPSSSVSVSPEYFFNVKAIRPYRVFIMSLTSILAIS